MATTIPIVKLEGDNNVKMEDASSPSAASDQFMDDADDDPELDSSDIAKELWLSKLPSFAWAALAGASDDTEIELGTIRVEGTLEEPGRVSLMLSQLPAFKSIEKEYVLRRQADSKRRSVDQQRKQSEPTPSMKRTGQLMLFSEKNKPGYKQRQSMWDAIDEDGNPGQGRSQLFEQGVREEKKKANKGKYVPYQKRPIPKITALAGTCLHAFEAYPVDNAEHQKLDQDRTLSAFKERERASIDIVNEVNLNKYVGSAISAAERQQINRSAQQKRAAAKDDRTARASKEAIRADILQRFREHRYWGLRDMRLAIRQPEQWVKENLEEMAYMHRSGDFNGKWELKPNLSMDDEALTNAIGEAPELDSDMDMKSDGDEDDDFEDVK